MAACLENEHKMAEEEVLGGWGKSYTYCEVLSGFVRSRKNLEKFMEF